MLRFLTFVRVLSQRPSASHQQGWTGPPQGEAVMDELAQSHYMKLCFGCNFLRHAALHHCCDPIGKKSDSTGRPRHNTPQHATPYMQ